MDNTGPRKWLVIEFDPKPWRALPPELQASYPDEETYVEALHHVAKGEATGGDVIVLAVSHVVAPLIMQTIVNMLRDAYDDDDNSLFDPTHWNRKDYLKAMAMGPLMGFPLLGGIADMIWSKATGRPSFRGDPTNPLNGATRLAAALEKMMSEKESERFEKGMVVATSAMSLVSVASAFHPASTWGQWFGSAGNVAKQLFQWGDNFTPDSPEEAARKVRAARSDAQKTAREKRKNAAR